MSILGRWAPPPAFILITLTLFNRRDSGRRLLLEIVLKIAQRIATPRKPVAPDPSRRRKRQPSRRIGKFDNDEPSAAMPGKHQAEPSVISWGVIDMRTPTTAARTPGPLTGIFQVLAEPEHWQTLLRGLFDRYRPEMHYMRGPVRSGGRSTVMPAHHLRPTIVAEGCHRPRHGCVEVRVAARFRPS